VTSFIQPVSSPSRPLPFHHLVFPNLTNSSQRPPPPNSTSLLAFHFHHQQDHSDIRHSALDSSPTWHGKSTLNRLCSRNFRNTWRFYPADKGSPFAERGLGPNRSRILSCGSSYLFCAHLTKFEGLARRKEGGLNSSLHSRSGTWYLSLVTPEVISLHPQSTCKKYYS
jgi:hypothetical protein